MPDENASLQVRRRGVRRRGVRPSFGLPVSPGTPFFPFFSSLFVFCLAVENGEFQSSCGVGERRRPRSCCVVVLLLLVPLVSFFFFYFGRRKWRNPELLRRRGEAEAAELPRSCCVVGVGPSGKKKTAQPKTTSFWVGLIFF